MTRHRLSAPNHVIVAAVIVAMVSGCSSSPETAVNPTPQGPVASVEPTATAAPSVSPTPKPSPSPTPTPPEAPTAMARDDPAGAKAAIQHFFDLRTYAYETGDIRSLDTISSSECEFCQSSIKNAEAQAAKGHLSVGAEMDVDRAEFISVNEGRFQNYDVRIVQGPWQVLDRSGGVVNEDTKTKVYEGITAVWREGGRWHVRAVDLVPEGTSR